MKWCSNRHFKPCDGKKQIEGYGPDKVTICEHGCKYTHDSKDEDTLELIAGRRHENTT